MPSSQEHPEACRSTLRVGGARHRQELATGRLESPRLGAPLPPQLPLVAATLAG